MGAKRLPGELRKRLDALMVDVLRDCQQIDGAIDLRRATDALALNVAAEPALLRRVRQEASLLALDSYVADYLRDDRMTLPVQGRRRSVRRWYRVPVAGSNRHVSKALEDCTADDLRALETYYQREGLSRLQQARALRGLRQEVASGSVLVPMPERA